ncbi:hypothetical protein C100_14355 [Sphingobium sp. C100]|uniref:ATP-binding protein n=1 Tax=Sphingobium sp. C100 TaxID=1207055 RepID=UPI0003D5FD82|nr:winged helix-turn-helix domain-containing protein [Sphingobium sp. C100]ETI63120.1 hypothetical protein C100_14355 [Sphingobium sp. C100]
MSISGDFGALSQRSAYGFGDFRLLPEQQTLLFQEKPVALGGRAFDILTLLVSRAGEVVSKADLFAHVWPDYIVHDHNLKVNVGNVRRSLAELDPDGEYIATIAGRGYKFVANVEIGGEPMAATRIAVTGHHISPPNVPRLFGRDEMIGLICEQLIHPGYLSIVGPGGVGKTSISIAAAQMCRGSDDAVAFVDLSTLNDPRFVVPAMASGVGVSLGLDDPIAGVIDRLRRGNMIVIIDNCEHVVAMAASVIERISSELPQARIVVTSREPLRTRHERVYFLPGLHYPDCSAQIDANDALAYPAIQLFLAKVQNVGVGELTDEYVRNIASVCARLEGLALAIELAAGTASALEPTALKQFFEHGFDMMSRGPRDAPLRHQTLEATLDWSYRLLTEREAVLLELLSLFSGRFSADDVEALYGAGGIEPMEGRDALSQLAAKSLVTTEFSQGTLLYRLPESTSAYASQRLFGAPYRQTARRQFAVSICTKLQKAEREWLLQTSRQWLGKYRALIDDVRSVIAWAFDPAGDAEVGAAVVVAALPLWQELPAFKEMLAAIETAETAGPAMAALSPVDRVKLSTAKAWAMTLARKMHPRTDLAWRNSIDHAREAGDPEFELPAVCGQAVFLTYSGRPLTAVRSMYHYAAVTGLNWDAVPDGKRFLAHAEIYAGRFSSASVRLEELTAACGHLTDGRRLSRFQVDLPVAIGLSHAFLFWLQGEAARASEVAGRAIARAAELNHMISLGNALCLAGLPVAYLNGDLATASLLQEQLAEVSKRENIGIYEGTSQFFSGAILAAQGDDAGLGIMQKSIIELEANNWLARVAFYQCLLADAWLKIGNVQQAEQCLKQALRQAHLREERWCHAELLRVAGVIEGRKGCGEKAERLLEKSVRWAQAMGAGSAIGRTRASN